MQTAFPEPNGGDIQALLRNIPACRRCRQNHRRCDPSLPSCRNCIKSGHKECIFFDPILGEDVERSRVMALASRLQELRAAAAYPRISTARSPPMSSRSLYFGQRSCISILSSVPSPLQPEETSLQPALPDFLSEVYNDLPSSANLHKFLVDNYLANVHALYPVVGDEEPFLDPNNGNHQPGRSPTQQFRLNMLYSTSCLCVPGHRQSHSLLPLAKAFHHKAMHHAEAATSDVSVSVLRNLAAMALNSLFAPDHGNLNQLIGLTSRMCVDLGVPRSDDASLHKLFLAIICMERQVALALDRPWFIPEPGDERAIRADSPVEICWSLLSIQCFLQRESGGGTPGEQPLHENTTCTLAALIRDLDPPPPNLVVTLREAELMTAEKSSGGDALARRAAASNLLRAHDGPCLRTCLSPYWTFKACAVYLENCASVADGRASDEMQLALLLLDRDVARWPNCRYLRDQLRNM